MSLHLVTGHRGNAHITSNDQGLFNAGCVGANDFVFATGRRFAAELIPNSTTIRIYDGSLLMNGRYVNMNSGVYLDVNITGGTTGLNRNDIIAVRYTKDADGIESADLVVLEGVLSSGTAIDPQYISGDILGGDNKHEMPLYRVKLSGLTISKLEPMFEVVVPMREMQRSYYPKNLIVNSDFQCNQRKITSLSTSNTGTYTLDMWRAYKIKLQSADNGVKVGNQTSGETGFFTQFVKVNNLADKYTICVRVDGVNYSFTTSVTDTSVTHQFDGKFEIGILYLSSRKLIKVNFRPSSTNYVTIGFIDLYEGEYAFPHVREDYGVALARCRQYIKHEKCIAPITYSYSDGSNKSYKVAIPHGSMAATPNVIVDYWQYTDNTGGAVFGGASVLLAMTSANDVSYARLPFKTPMQTDSSAVEVTYTASCEPDDE